MIALRLVVDMMGYKDRLSMRVNDRLEWILSWHFRSGWEWEVNYTRILEARVELDDNENASFLSM